VIAAQFHDGGRHEAGGFAGIEDEREAITELAENLFTAGAGRGVRDVGAGAGERDAKFGNEIRDNFRLGPAQGDAAGVGGDLEGETVRGVDDDGERAGPAGFREAIEIVGQRFGENERVIQMVDEDGKGAVLGASFNAEDLFDSGEIDGIGGQGVKRICRNGNDRTTVQPSGSVADDTRVGIGCTDFENLGRHAIPYLFWSEDESLGDAVEIITGSNTGAMISQHKFRGGKCKREKVKEWEGTDRAGVLEVRSENESMASGRARDGSHTPAAAAEVITSRDNRWLKEFRVALRGGVPTASGAVGVEGTRLMEEALTSGCRVEAVLFGESGERHRERLAPLIGRPEMGFPVLRTTDRLFEGVADTEHPQGVAALVAPRVWTLEELIEGSGAPLLVVLAGVQDPGNVGTIVRTAVAFGATGAVTAATGQSGTASPYAPKALRASAGAALHLPIVNGMAMGILLTQLKMLGIRTLASCVEGTSENSGAPKAMQSAAMAPWEVNWREAVALLVGNEGAGLPEDIVRGADARVHIPMATLPSSGQARVESLNAAAAAAVVLYEAFRQRKKKEGLTGC